jgi:hypothetical protein
MKIRQNSGIRYSALKFGPESVEWCKEHFGESNILTGRYSVLEWTIHFKNEADRNWYVMRWQK